MSLVHFYKIVDMITGDIFIGNTVHDIKTKLKKREMKYMTIHLIDTVQCADKKFRNTLQQLYLLDEKHNNPSVCVNHDNKLDKIHCLCGGYYSGNQARHMNTRKHKDYKKQN
jgi:hypothetical protein